MPYFRTLPKIEFYFTPYALCQTVFRSKYHDQSLLCIFYPHLIYGIEFYGHAADCHLNQIYLLQKAALRITLKIPPRGHVTTYFKEMQIMPIDMLFKYRFLIHFHKANFNNELDIEKAPPPNLHSLK